MFLFTCTLFSIFKECQVNNSMCKHTVSTPKVSVIIISLPYFGYMSSCLNSLETIYYLFCYTIY